MDLALARVDAARCSSTTSRGLASRRPGRRPRCSIARHGGLSPRIGGTRNRPSSAAGAAASTSSRSRHGHDDVVAQHVGERVRLGHRLDVVEVERVDVGGVLEDRRELVGVVLELVGGQIEPGQARHMGNVLSRDALRHGLSCYGTQSRSRSANLEVERRPLARSRARKRPRMAGCSREFAGGGVAWGVSPWPSPARG